MSDDMPSARDAICVVVTGSGADRYGADEMLLRVAAGLDRDAFDVTVALPGAGPLTHALLSAGLAKVHEVPIPVLRREVLRPARFVRFLLELAASISLARAFLREQRPRLLWVNTIVTPTWIIAGRLERIPTVCHSHEITAAPLLARKLLYLPMLLCSKVVAVSEAVRSELVATYARLGTRTAVVMNPSFEFPSGLPLPVDRECDVLVVGRISPRKGQHVMIDALSGMSEADRPNVHICGTAFRGYEWYEEQLRATVAERGLPVAMHGFVPREDAYRMGGIVVIPSTEPESCPLVVLEALSAGRAVVASDCGGIPEIADGGAITVPPGDALALRHAISNLVKSPEERHRLVSAARRRSLELSPEKYFAALSSLARSTARQDVDAPHALPTT